MHESILVYRHFRYLKVAIILGIVGIAAYGFHTPLGAPNGGTWLGYILGGIGAALILWLMWFGLRKRFYRAGKIKLEDWLSAHVYLGLSLIVVATLHTGFQFGWNVHTAAYVLMLIVILSGAFGVYTYIRYPRLMTENRRGVTLDAMLGQIADLDREIRGVGMEAGEEINRSLLKASQESRIGGGAWRLLKGDDPDCPTTAARKLVEQVADKPHDDERTMRRLLGLLVRKEEMLRRARRDAQLGALMQVWLMFHVPLSFALLAALIAHVLSVFFYW